MNAEQLKAIEDLQESVNEFLTMPQYRQYVQMHKLSLLDGRFKVIDALLDKGILHC